MGAFHSRTKRKETVAWPTPCSICLEPFSDPKLLPCGHTFCCECLGAHMRASSSRGEFSCPECRRSHAIPQEGANGFPKNRYIQVFPKNGDTNNQPPMGDATKSTRTFQKCPKHLGMTQDLFCEYCETTGCARCFLEIHENHPYIDITEKVRTSLESTSEGASNLMMPILAIESEMQGTKVQIKRETENAIRMIQMKANRTCELARKHEKKVVQEISSKRDRSLAKLQRCQEALDIKKGCVSNLIKCRDTVNITGCKDELALAKEFEKQLERHQSQSIGTFKWSLTEDGEWNIESVIPDLVGNVSIEVLEDQEELWRHL